MINLNLSHSDNRIGITPEEAITLYSDVNDGYDVNIQNLVFPSKESLDEFISALNQKDLEVYDYLSNSIKNFVSTIKYKCDDFRIYVNSNEDSKDMYACISAKDDSIALNCWNVYINTIKKYKSNINFIIESVYMDSQGSISQAYKDVKDVSYRLSVSKEYYPYIDTDVLFKQFFKSDESILILSGASGLGKSKFALLCMNYLIENYSDLYNTETKFFDNNINICFVKNAHILASEDFWHDLDVNQDRYPLVIIDDLDFMLTSRSEETLSEDDAYKNLFLNNFLTFTDGVLKSKVKFVITTNQKISDIDQALMRKGRLFDILELRKLRNSEALEIWKNNGLDDEVFKKKFKSDVLASDLGSMIQKYLNTSILENQHSYLKETKISKIETFKTKKLGL